MSMNFVQRKQMQVYLVKKMWQAGYRFLACYNLNPKADGLRKLMNQNSVVRITGKGKGGKRVVHEEIKPSEVFKMVIESAEIPNYVVVVLPPSMATEYEVHGDIALAIDHKAQELFRIFNLAPAKSKMTTPKPFTNYRKEVVKTIEHLDDVVRMVMLS